MQALRDRSRDNARSPFQWDSDTNAGFSNHKPWINTVGNYKEINLEKQRNDENSIFNTFKNIFRFRKEFTLNEGNVNFYNLEDNETIIYVNKTEKLDVLVISSFKGHEISINISEELLDFEFYKSNYDEKQLEKTLILRAYESLVFIKKRGE